MTSSDLKRPQLTSNENGKKIKTKNNLEGGFVQDNVETKGQYLDENLYNKVIRTLICMIRVLYSYSYTNTMIKICKIVFVQL